MLVIKKGQMFKLNSGYKGEKTGLMFYMLTQQQFGTRSSFKKKLVNESSYILSNYVHNMKMQYTFFF